MYACFFAIETGRAAAIVLGTISPHIVIITVTSTVETVIPNSSPIMEIAVAAPIEDARILKKFIPISTTVSS